MKPLARVIEIFSVLGLVNPTIVRATLVERLISLQTGLVHWNLPIAAIFSFFELNALPLE